MNEEEKTLNSEHGDLHIVYMKDLTLTLRIYQNWAATFNVLSFLEFMAQFSDTVLRPKNVASPPLSYFYSL